jgi:gas vesicle protein
MREIVGFVMGAAAGAAGALFVSSTEGRALLERLRDEARPEAERATTEWEPVLREMGRAVRLAVRELETATVDLRARIGEIAAALPDDEVALALPALDPATEPEATTAAPAVDEAPPAVDAVVDEPASAT